MLWESFVYKLTVDGCLLTHLTVILLYGESPTAWKHEEEREFLRDGRSSDGRAADRMEERPTNRGNYSIPCCMLWLAQTCPIRIKIEWDRRIFSSEYQ
jgi:hypothetical protein